MPSPLIHHHQSSVRGSIVFMDKDAMGEPFPAAGRHRLRAVFRGNSYLDMLLHGGRRIGNVTFRPGCRNNWHIHKARSGGGRYCCASRG